MHRPLAFAFLLLLPIVSPARAEEGMWTFDAVPAAAIARTYDFTPGGLLLDNLRGSALRLNEGCTAAFVSPHGLIMTSHHCVVDCVAQASTPQTNYVELGFDAGAGDERTCKNFEVDQLVRVSDVTKTVLTATAQNSAETKALAIREATGAIERACGNETTIRCEVVSLYNGNIYDLYAYRRYTDVRLVFAPEFAVAQFGGDSATFGFPRYDFDIGFLRAYDRGRPIAVTNYLHWSAAGSAANDLVFAAANPGPARRHLTLDELAFERRYRYPAEIPRLAEYRGILEQFQARGADAGSSVTGPLYAAQNKLRDALGEQEALEDSDFIALRQAEEKRLRQGVAANPALQLTDGSAWDELAALQTLRAHLYPSYEAVSGDEFDSGLLGYARTLVRAASERKKPDAQRLAGFSDESLLLLREQLSSAAPVSSELEEVRLAFGLTNLRARLGADDPLVQSFLGKESPEALAHRLVSETKLGDPAVRDALFEGGQAAIDASADPMIAYARYLDDTIRTVVKDYETRIVEPTRLASARIANARYALYGANDDPDGTFTLRLSYGTVAGFDANGTAIKPYTTFGGLFDGATASPPYALPPSWFAAKPALDLTMPMNVSTTIDSVGGDSGRPLVNRDGNVVGLLSGGNSYSLGSTFGYDLALDRSVALDSRAILAALDKIYHASRLVSELEQTIE